MPVPEDDAGRFIVAEEQDVEEVSSDDDGASEEEEDEAEEAAQLDARDEGAAGAEADRLLAAVRSSVHGSAEAAAGVGGWVAGGMQAPSGGPAVGAEMAGDLQCMVGARNEATETLRRVRALDRGLPEDSKLLCCRGRCQLYQLAVDEERLLEITEEAARLRAHFVERPAAAAARGTGFAALVKRKRAGQRGDVTSNAAVTGRLPRHPKNKEKVLALDKFGWFRETRARERRRYIAETLPLLRAAGMCSKGICAVLHCSTKTLYDADNNVMAGLGLLRKRQHGKRDAALGGFAQLHEVACGCPRNCNAALAAGYAEQQYDLWVRATNEEEKLSVLAEHVLFDRSSGIISARCAKSVDQQLGGVSAHRVAVTKHFLSLSKDGQELERRHGNTRNKPWNSMSAEHQALCLQRSSTGDNGFAVCPLLGPLE